MLLTVLIPVFRLDDNRKRNLEFIYNRLISHYDESEIEIILGIQDEYIDTYYHKFHRAIIRHYDEYGDKKFNKSYLYNRCIEDGIDGDYLVFLDADVYFPFNKLRKQILNYNYDVIKPFSECIFLDEKTTEKFLVETKVAVPQGAKIITATGACCIILNKNILPEIQMDENFTGWGFEDIDFANRLSKKYNIYTINQKAVHLYHEPSIPNNKNEIYYRNKYKYSHKTYRSCKRKDIGIVIKHSFKEPKNNLLTIIDTLKTIKCPVSLIEITDRHSKSLLLPDWIEYYISNNNTNLYSVINNYINYEKILFLDSNILFNDSNFIDNTSKLLDTYDIVQPFETSLLLNRDMTPLLDYNYIHSIAKGIHNQENIEHFNYNSGFAWGITKCIFQKYFNDKDLNLLPEDRIKVGYLEQCTARHLYHEFIDTKYKNFSTIPERKNVLEFLRYFLDNKGKYNR